MVNYTACIPLSSYRYLCICYTMQDPALYFDKVPYLLSSAFRSIYALSPYAARRVLRGHGGALCGRVVSPLVWACVGVVVRPGIACMACPGVHVFALSCALHGVTWPMAARCVVQF